MNKRTFLKQMTLAGLGPLASHSFFEGPLLNSLPKLPLEEEAIWELVRKQYELHPDFINLESGYYNITPQPTMDKYLEHLKRVNLEGSFYMRNHRFKDKAWITNKLAETFGCDSSNLVITRNTTESLDLIVSGFPWKKDDHAIYALQDYGAMQDMFLQIKERYGVKLTTVSVPNHPQSDAEIVELYESQITPKTKMIMLCHMINITGQILPVKKICKMAHRHGVEVLVDGAHCIGHFEFKISELDCDYYGSSLHKWLATPLGAGLLYVKSDHISKIWPLLADNEKNLSNIKRLSHTGTHPVATDLAISNAIDYLQWLGMKRKEERMRFLKNYWYEALRDVPNIVINTPIAADRSCGIGNIGIQTLSPHLLAERLFKEFKIFTVAIDYANVKGCRITPNIFTSIKELDEFVNAMKSLAKA